MPRPRTARDYQDGITTASRAGLAEIMTALGAYRDALVLIGGWAPYLILERFGEQRGLLVEFWLDVDRLGGVSHVGSIDIDLVVDPGIIDAERYATIVELLHDRGYEPAGESLFQFEKTLRSPRDGQDYLIRVDLPSGDPTIKPKPPSRSSTSSRIELASGNPWRQASTALVYVLRFVPRGGLPVYGEITTFRPPRHWTRSTRWPVWRPVNGSSRNRP
jgi:hypothetical protein